MESVKNRLSAVLYAKEYAERTITLFFRSSERTAEIIVEKKKGYLFRYNQSYFLIVQAVEQFPGSYRGSLWAASEVNHRIEPFRIV
jgi:hypothetical protein